MQLEVKAQVEEHVRLKAMQRGHQLALEEAQREEERTLRKMANKELEKFRQRVSNTIVSFAGSAQSQTHSLCW